MARRKKKKTNNILFIIYLIISLITMGILLYLKILPIKYSSTILIIYGVASLILFILSKSKKTRLFSNIVSTILIIIFGLILYYLSTTMNFISKIINDNFEIESYYVIVKKDSKYESLNELENKKIGIYNIESKSQEKAINKLEKRISFKKQDYSDINTLGSDLLKNNIKAIFISESYYGILVDEYDNFEENTKILETFKVKLKTKKVSKSVSVTEKPFNIYISGIDTYGSISSVSRSDVNMIVTVNPKTHKILLTSIPRDYYVRLHNTSGYKDKLTHAGIYGINMSVKTIEDLLDIDINYYVRVNFTTLIDIVDVIGGVDVYSDYEFTSLHGNYKFKKGINHMNGEQALGFVRERYSFKEGDRQRVKNQQAVIVGIINKLTNSTKIITKYSSILNSLSNSFQTNMESDKIYSLINMQLDNNISWDINNYSLNGTGSSEYTYSYGSQKLYVMIPDINTINEAKEKINEIENN